MQVGDLEILFFFYLVCRVLQLFGCIWDLRCADNEEVEFLKKYV